jgi:hypothetical protein
VAYTGSVDVDGVNVVESAAGEPVVAWTSLRAGPLRFGLAPDRLEIDEVRLTGLDGRLVIFQDKTVSVARLMKPAGEPVKPVGEPAGATPPSGPRRSATRASSGFRARCAPR